jgi:hypothetical protein
MVRKRMRAPGRVPEYDATVMARLVWADPRQHIAATDGRDEPDHDG